MEADSGAHINRESNRSDHGSFQIGAANTVTTARPPAQRQEATPDGMTAAAASKFRDCVQEFSRALSRETSRLEEAERAEGVINPEITATMVIKANEAIRNPRPSEPRPAPIGALIAQVATFVLAIFAGVFGSYLHSPWQWLAMIGCAAFGALTVIYAGIALWRRQ